MYSILIPVTDIKGDKNKKDLENLLCSIKAGGYLCSVLVCFDSCHEDFIEYFIERFPNITPIFNNGNRLNFARNVNNGLKYLVDNLKDNHVVLVNQDSILPSRDRFEFILKNDEPCIVSAQSMDISGDLEKTIKALNSLNDSSVKAYTKVNRFPFYCTFIHKDVLNKLGGLDGGYIASFEDDDYCTRSLLAGFTNYTSSVIIYREGTHVDPTAANFVSASGSYGKNRLANNLTRYCTKYQVPSKITHEEAIEWISKNIKWKDSMKIELRSH